MMLNRLTSYVMISLAGICLLSSQAFPEQSFHFTSEIDTPTAYTIGRGTYNLSLWGYDQGGVEFKAYIGLHDYFYLGASFDVEHAIGKEKPHANIPGVVAKIKFTDGWETFPISVAIGYDSFYIGTPGKYKDDDNDAANRMIYGPYFVITKPIYLLNSEQHISGGIRVPAQPKFVAKDTAYFASLDIPLGKYFTLKGETERIYYNLHRPKDWLFNAGMQYSFLMKFGVEFDIICQRHERVNRVIRVEYSDAF
ncbi:MAG TPA: hypothetical protein VF857_07200 [Spirochaetota bacterium]